MARRSRSRCSSSARSPSFSERAHERGEPCRGFNSLASEDESATESSATAEQATRSSSAARKSHVRGIAAGLAYAVQAKAKRQEASPRLRRRQLAMILPSSGGALDFDGGSGRDGSYFALQPSTLSSPSSDEYVGGQFLGQPSLEHNPRSGCLGLFYYYWHKWVSSRALSGLPFYLSFFFLKVHRSIPYTPRLQAFVRQPFCIILFSSRFFRLVSFLLHTFCIWSKFFRFLFS